MLRKQWLPGFAALLIEIGMLIRPLHGQQSRRVSGLTVLEVQYDPPQQPIDPKDLKGAQMVAIGRPLDRDVAATIDRLYATGLYRDIKAYADPQE